MSAGTTTRMRQVFVLKASHNSITGSLPSGLSGSLVRAGSTASPMHVRAQSHRSSCPSPVEEKEEGEQRITSKNRYGKNRYGKKRERERRKTKGTPCNPICTNQQADSRGKTKENFRTGVIFMKLRFLVHSLISGKAPRSQKRAPFC